MLRAPVQRPLLIRWGWAYLPPGACGLSESKPRARLVLHVLASSSVLDAEDQVGVLILAVGPGTQAFAPEPLVPRQQCEVVIGPAVLDRVVMCTRRCRAIATTVGLTSEPGQL